MTGKICSLPADIQDQLNQRLLNGQPASTLLPWLNGLPQTKSILKEQFNGAPITKQNLSEHRNHGFRDWRDRQQALDFASTLTSGDAQLQRLLPVDLADKLARWISLRFAVSARDLASSQSGSDKSLRHLRNFSLFIMALRRGELSAARLAIDQQRLAVELSASAQAKEKEFWEWTRRPEIQHKLHPYRNPEREKERVFALVDEHLLGKTSEPRTLRLEEEDPAMLI
ncbi:MAG TPA: hypothetical protein VG167_08945 [Verrucomicrobiae bacterium]|nr:hypothetical protein [Verrucomicrobiae bacterium]